MNAWLILASLLPATLPPPELTAVMGTARPDLPVTREVREGETWIQFTSQIWEGRPWRHTLVLTPAPDGSRHATGDLAILEITGGAPNPADLAMARRAAEATGLPVATLYDIPNQPIDGRYEDDLIAHTFEGFLRDGRPEQLLPFAMATSAVRAMDVLGEVGGYRRFIPTGASKRGWTTWLAAATGDRRIVALAPRVFDMLKIPQQLAHQMESWGKFSPMIGDYTRRDLPGQATEAPGIRLMTLVDPFSYRSRIRVPTLIVNGTNDAYWTVDAQALYVPELPGPTWLLQVPNVGHGMGDRAWDQSGITGFIRAIAQRVTLPKPRYESINHDGRIGVRLTPNATVREARLWVAIRPDRHFDAAVWRDLRRVDDPAPNLATELSVRRPKGEVVAWFLEVDYALTSGPFTTTSAVSVDGPMAGPP